MAYGADLAEMVVDVLKAAWPTWKVYGAPVDGARFPAFIVNVVAADYHGFVGNPEVAEWTVVITAIVQREPVKARITQLAALTDPGSDGVRARLEDGLDGMVGAPLVSNVVLEEADLTPDKAVAMRWLFTCFGPVAQSP